MLDPNIFTTIILDNKKFEGILTFESIRKIQKDLEDAGLENKVYHIFKNLSNLNDAEKQKEVHLTISSFLLNTLLIKNKEEDINNAFKKEDDVIDYFKRIYTYINLVINRCMAKSEDEEDEYEKPDWWSPKDWDFSEFEYTWYSVLKRSDNFYSITPKMYFDYIKIHNKLTKK